MAALVDLDVAVNAQKPGIGTAQGAQILHLSFLPQKGALLGSEKVERIGHQVLADSGYLAAAVNRECGTLMASFQRSQIHDVTLRPENSVYLRNPEKRPQCGTAI